MHCFNGAFVASLLVALNTAALSSVATDNATGSEKQRDHAQEGSPEATSAPAYNDHEWAIVTVPQANAYTKSGKRFGTLSAGQTVAITGYANSDRRRMAVCRMASLSSSFILDTAALRVFKGNIEHVDRKVLELRVHSAKLEAEKRKLETGPAGIHKDYPRYNSYVKVRKDYIAYWKRVDELKRLRENTSDDKRMGVEDELRTLKQDEYTIGSAYHDAKVKYDNWAELRPRRPDPKIAELDKQMELIEARIKEVEGDQ